VEGIVFVNPQLRSLTISVCLYLTEIKPSRKNANAFTDWLKNNHPECTFTEANLLKKSYPVVNRGRYQGRVEGPEGWADDSHASDREAVYEAARRLLRA
jgi:FMN-dependent NADH-azoreductase